MRRVLWVIQFVVHIFVLECIFDSYKSLVAFFTTTIGLRLLLDAGVVVVDRAFVKAGSDDS
jgi:hypothetical protein